MMKIFWSWQSDHSKKISKHFIKKCIEKALSELSKEVDFLDRKLSIDHDTKDVPGSPPITETIFEKIELCDIFIADVTPVAETRNGKKIMNPNVAIEMGYAIAKLSNRKILTVMNKEYGDITDLPFDLRHKRGPIIYCLNSESNIKEAEDDLTRKLKEAIKLHANDIEQTEAKQKPKTEPIFFNSNEPIMRLDSDVWSSVRDVEYFVKMNNSYIYSIVTPLKGIQLSKKEAKEKLFASNRFTVPLLYGSANNTSVTNRYGAILAKFHSDEASHEVTDLVQLFKDGTLISLSNSFLYYSKNKIHLRYLYQCFKNNLIGSLQLIKDTTVSDIEVKVEIGIVNKDKCTVVRQHPKGNRQYIEPEVGPLEEELYTAVGNVNTGKNEDVEKIIENLVKQLIDDLGIEFTFSDHDWQ